MANGFENEMAEVFHLSINKMAVYGDYDMNLSRSDQKDWILGRFNTGGVNPSSLRTFFERAVEDSMIHNASVSSQRKSLSLEGQDVVAELIVSAAYVESDAKLNMAGTRPYFWLLNMDGSPEAAQQNKELDAKLEGMTPEQRGTFLFEKLNSIQALPLEEALSMSDEEVVSCFGKRYTEGQLLGEIDNILKNQTVSLSQEQQQALRGMKDRQDSYFYLKSRMDVIINPFYETVDTGRMLLADEDALDTLSNRLLTLDEKNPVPTDFVDSIREQKNMQRLVYGKYMEKALSDNGLNPSIAEVTLADGSRAPLLSDEAMAALREKQPVEISYGKGLGLVVTGYNNDAPQVTTRLKAKMGSIGLDDESKIFATSSNNAFAEKAIGQSLNNRLNLEKGVLILPQNGAPAMVRAEEDQINVYSMTEYFSKLDAQLQNANKGFFIGSGEFRNMSRAFQALQNDYIQIDQEMSVEDSNNLKELLNTTAEACRAYLDTKNVDPSAVPETYGKNAREKRRIDAALEIYNFVKEQEELITQFRAIQANQNQKQDMSEKKEEPKADIPAQEQAKNDGIKQEEVLPQQEEKIEEKPGEEVHLQEAVPVEDEHENYYDQLTQIAAENIDAMSVFDADHSNAGLRKAILNRAKRDAAKELLEEAEEIENADEREAFLKEHWGQFDTMVKDMKVFFATHPSEEQLSSMVGGKKVDYTGYSKEYYRAYDKYKEYVQAREESFENEEEQLEEELNRSKLSDNEDEKTNEFMLLN